MTTFIVTVSDDKIIPGKTRIKLHESNFPIPGDAVGECRGETCVSDELHIGAGIGMLFEDRYGHPQPGPELRNLTDRLQKPVNAPVDVNRFIRDGIDNRGYA